jgi:cytochrome c biogenesis protein CcmG/thiol:disulfide interchange protein DsbE
MSEPERFTPRAWHLILIVLLVALFTLFYKGLWGDPSAIPTVLIGTRAPDFTAPEVMGSDIRSLNQFRDKVVMVNFWASWCQECRVEHENLLALHQQFGSNPDFVMLGIDYQDKLDDAKKYIEVYRAPWLNIRDFDGKISIDYGVYGVPETFIIDRQGIIRHKQVGPIVGPSYAYLRERVLPALLRGAGPSTS